MDMGTLCTGKNTPICGYGDTLVRQKGVHIWAWGRFAWAKRPPSINMATLCTNNKDPIYALALCTCEKVFTYEHRDSLQWQKSPSIWAWGHFALTKRRSHIGTGTLCNSRKAPMYGHGDRFHWQTPSHIWASEHFALAKRPSYIGMETLCTGKKAPIYGHGHTLQLQKSATYRHGDTFH